MSDLGRQFDFNEDFPVVRSRSRGTPSHPTTVYASVDPSGNESYREWEDEYGDVNSDIDHAESGRWDADQRREAAWHEREQHDDDSEEWAAADAEYSAAVVEQNELTDVLDRAYQRQAEVEDRAVHPNAIGVVTYKQQGFRPTNDLEWEKAPGGTQLSLFEESQKPEIDNWASDPGYSGHGIGKELLNHAVEEHWRHFPKERGTMPPISSRLSDASQSVLDAHAPGHGVDTSIWTTDQDRMDSFAISAINRDADAPVQRYMEHSRHGMMPEEGTNIGRANPGPYEPEVVVAPWPSTSFKDKVGELEARKASEDADAAERRGRWTGPLSKAARNPGSAAHLAAQFDSPTGQLPLFVTGRELRGAATPHPGDRLNETDGLDRTESTQELWARKKSEADTSGMTESIAKKGIVRPVRITGGGIIKNGNHRVAGLGDDQWTSPDYDHNEGSMPGPMGDAPARFRPELVGLPKFNAR